MMNKSGRNIRRKTKSELAADLHLFPKNWRKDDWPALLSSGSAMIHHNHNGSASHELCGPILFCCQRSIQIYRDLYPESSVAHSKSGPVSAEQIVSWMDAGMQALYFVYCQPSAPDDLAAACLVGQQARRVVRGLEQLSTENSCSNLLDEIAGNGYIDLDLGGDDLAENSIV